MEKKWLVYIHHKQVVEDLQVCKRFKINHYFNKNLNMEGPGSPRGGLKRAKNLSVAGLFSFDIVNSVILI
jgi:hypothetical protein